MKCETAKALQTGSHSDVHHETQQQELYKHSYVSYIKVSFHSVVLVTHHIILYRQTQKKKKKTTQGTRFLREWVMTQATSAVEKQVLL